MRRWPVLAVLLVVGCGSAPAGAARPSASSSADASGAAREASQAAAEPLFAVLEPGGDFALMRNDVVAIVRVDGTARAKAGFKPRRLPQVGEGLTLPEVLEDAAGRARVQLDRAEPIDVVDEPGGRSVSVANASGS